MKKRMLFHLKLFFVLFLLLLFTAWFQSSGSKSSVMEWDEFREMVEVKEETAVIGTNIYLHQVIHGEGKETYRYKLETDCPHWDYEDRYETERELSFVSENSAVETNAALVKVIMDGQEYASGQYFEVPVLGLRKDGKTITEFREELLSTAYAQYQAEQSHKKTVFWYPIIILLAMGPVIIIGGNYGWERWKEESGICLIAVDLRPEKEEFAVFAIPAEQKKEAVIRLKDRGQKCDIVEQMAFSGIQYHYVGSISPSRLGKVMSDTIDKTIIHC